MAVTVVVVDELVPGVWTPGRDLGKVVPAGLWAPIRNLNDKHVIEIAIFEYCEACEYH